MPVVSVLISTYNRRDYLQLALASVLAQTFTDFEVIVRDDGSATDAARDIVAELQDARFSYRRNERNVGMVETNTRLYREANGDYVAHLDDDDEWTPTFLARMVAALDEHQDVNLAFANHNLVTPEGELRPDDAARDHQLWGRAGLTTGRYENGRYLAAVTRAIPVSHSAVIRASALNIDDFNPEMGEAWDMWLACLAVRKNGAVWFDADHLTLSRMHANQMSGQRSTDSTWAGLVWNLRQLVADDAYVTEHPVLKRQLADYLLKWGAHQSVRERRFGHGLRKVRESIQIRARS